MSETPKDDEKRFNETLKRMLKTPPDPKPSKEKSPVRRKLRDKDEQGRDDDTDRE